MDRRHFVRTSAWAGAGLGLSGLGLLAQQAAQAQSSNSYKALVCVYLFGGNDGYNTLVPYESTAHSQYLTLRPEYRSASSTGLGLPRNALLALSPAGGGRAASLGLHPALARTHDRWGQGQVAWLQNVGNLVEPVDRHTYVSRRLPLGLGGHDSQQDVSMLGLQDPQGEGAEQGWGSRMWQTWALSQSGMGQDLAQVSFGGQNRWQASPSLPLTALTANQSINLIMGTELSALLQQGQTSSRPFTRAYADAMARTYRQGSVINAVFADMSSSASSAFASTTGGVGGPVIQQLQSVARFIEARSQLQAPGRQVFFVSAGGYDTHEGQYNRHAALLAELDTGLHGFFSAMEALGLGQQVTAFTMSDFGRTLRANASHGTDHAWASHLMVMGGAVRGGVYGRAADIAPISTDVVSNDSNWVIPSTSINQYAATLAAWMGLSPTDLNVVFPDLHNFPQANLGFMNS